MDGGGGGVVMDNEIHNGDIDCTQTHEDNSSSCLVCGLILQRMVQTLHVILSQNTSFKFQPILLFYYYFFSYDINARM